MGHGLRVSLARLGFFVTISSAGRLYKKPNGLTGFIIALEHLLFTCTSKDVRLREPPRDLSKTHADINQKYGSIQRFNSLRFLGFVPTSHLPVVLRKTPFMPVRWVAVLDLSCRRPGLHIPSCTTFQHICTIGRAKDVRLYWSEQRRYHPGGGL